MNETKPRAKAQSNPKRAFRATNKVMHDLYKLDVAMMLKNIAIEGMEADYLKVEHCHFYHSVDAKGVPQSLCSPIGGHFHEITVVTPATETEPAVLKCGPAMKYVLDPRTKRKIMQAAEPGDMHTHEMSYVWSEEFKPKKINMEATRYVASVQAQEPAPVPGIIG